MSSPPPLNGLIGVCFFRNLIGCLDHHWFLWSLLWCVFGPRVEKICYIIKIPKKGKNVRDINDTIFKGFLGSRNQMKKYFFWKKVNLTLKGHLKVKKGNFRLYFEFIALFGLLKRVILTFEVIFGCRIVFPF